MHFHTLNNTSKTRSQLVLFVETHSANTLMSRGRYSYCEVHLSPKLVLCSRVWRTIIDNIAAPVMKPYLSNCQLNVGSSHETTTLLRGADLP